MQMHKGCLRYQFTFYKSPNVIRLKEFSKKYENFLFVEVINRWIGRLKGCQDGVANFVFYDSGLTKNIYYNEYL